MASIIEKLRAEQYGFISSAAELARVVHENRLQPIIIRCGGCRLMAPAQDVARLVGIIEAAEGEYVRDISIAPARGC
jgi:hypothetical protein